MQSKAKQQQNGARAQPKQKRTVATWQRGKGSLYAISKTCTETQNELVKLPRKINRRLDNCAATLTKNEKVKQPIHSQLHPPRVLSDVLFPSSRLVNFASSYGRSNSWKSDTTKAHTQTALSCGSSSSLDSYRIFQPRKNMLNDFFSQL